MLSCTDRQKQEHQTVVAHQNLSSIVEDSSIVIDFDSSTTQLVKDTCECGSESKEWAFGPFHSDTALYFGWSDSLRNDSIVDHYKTHHLASEVKTIIFENFEQIPKQYAVFSEVEKVEIAGHRATSGLEIYPKLEAIWRFDHHDFDFTLNAAWLFNLKSIQGEKLRIIGFQSWAQVPNLIDFHVGAVRFDTIPTDFHRARCLQSLTLFGLYSDHSIGDWDFSKNHCLKRINVSSIMHGITDLPQGLEDLDLKEIDIGNRWTLNTKAKAKLKRLKDKIKQVND